MCKNKIKVCLIGSGLIPVTELHDYFIGKLGHAEILFEDDVLDADVAFTLAQVSDQSSENKLKVALSNDLIILDELQINALLK